jgi:hypothetical protein
MPAPPALFSHRSSTDRNHFILSTAGRGEMMSIHPMMGLHNNKNVMSVVSSRMIRPSALVVVRSTLITRRQQRRSFLGPPPATIGIRTRRCLLIPYDPSFHCHKPHQQHPMMIRGLSSSLRTSSSSSATKKPPSAPFAPKVVPDPTSQQLRAYFWTCAVPMFGFGFMDNTIMILAGNYLDLTIGVTFGLSTLAAAALGQLVANATSVVFGDTVETVVRRMGLPSSGLSSPQRRLRHVRRVGVWGSLVGVVCGAALGLVNLLFVDTKQSTRLKLDALTKDQEFEFEIDVSNQKRRDATTVTVTGPDVDGVLASLTAAITSSGYSLVELRAASRDHNDPANHGTHIVEDVFVLRPRGGGQSSSGQIDDRDLEKVGQVLLAACRDPLSAHSLKTQVQDLTSENESLKDRVQFLETVITTKQIRIEPRGNDNNDDLLPSRRTTTRPQRT